MRLPSVFVSSLLLSAVLPLRAELLELITVTGKTYHQCRVVKIEPDGVSFRHASGAGKVLFKDLTKPLRDHFGFDPVKARAHEEKLRAEKKQTRAAAEEKARVEWQARVVVIERMMEQETQQLLRAALNQSQGMRGGDWITLSGSSPLFPMGVTLDGSDYYRAGHREAWSPWCGVRHGVPQFVNPTPGYAGSVGFRPGPFIAVPGIGPNVPVAALRARVPVRGSIGRGAPCP